MSSQPLGKLVERALRKAVSRQVSHTDKRARLEAVMDKTVELAMEGEPWAVQFIGDRLDGKAKQQLEVEISNRMTVVIGHSVPETIVDASGSVPILDVDQDAAARMLPSRGIDTETEPLPAPEPYVYEKVQRDQRSRDDPRVDSVYVVSAQDRIARIRARAAIAAADIVPVDGVRAGGSAVDAATDEDGATDGMGEAT